MKNWQDDYARKLAGLSVAELHQLKADKMQEIKRADKRTHNGRLIEIFNKAEIFEIDEAIKGRANYGKI